MSGVSVVESLKSGEKARLIPAGATTNLEAKATSIFLASLSVVEGFAEGILGNLGQRIGQRAKIECLTEVVLPQNNGLKDRPDGLISVTVGKRNWTALVEAKIGNALLNPEQLEKYITVAKSNKIDAIITISNQFSVLPTHHPIKLPKTLTRNIEIYHLSWTYIVTQAVLQLRVEQNIDPEQKYILEEMVRYFEHPSSGVKTFDQMNREWKDLCLLVKSGGKISKISDMTQNTVGAWYQAERNMSLLLTRELGVPVALRLSKKHKDNPEARLKDDCDLLASDQILHSTYIVPDAAAPIEMVADLKTRTLKCSMRLAAPEDRKSTKARINWLLNQLKKVTEANIYLCAEWPGRSPLTSAQLEVIRENPEMLQSENSKLVPNWFQVMMIIDLAGKFSGSKTFLEGVSTIVPLFYKNIGQNLRAWVPPPPKLRENDSEGADESEADDVLE